MANVLNKKRSLPHKVGVTLVVGSFVIGGNHYVGQYGIMRGVNEIFDKLCEEKHLTRGSKLAENAYRFRRNLNNI